MQSQFKHIKQTKLWVKGETPTKD